MMITLDDIVKELEATGNVDIIRNKYIQLIGNYRDRNIICYYSGWLKQKQSLNYSISDMDLNGIVNATNNLDTSKGLDIILHTPGGDPTATEAIVKFLRDKFNDIQVIVPHMAMSAGTMLSCSANKIYMSAHSSLGPIDPQFSGIPAYDIKKEFETAKREMTKNPSSAQYWQTIISKYPHAFYNIVCDAIKLSTELAYSWLYQYMFDGKNKKTAENITKKLNSNNKSHAKHFNYTDCQSIGLNVEKIENDSQLYDLVIALHYTLTLTFQITDCSKIICNNKGNTYIVNN